MTEIKINIKVPEQVPQEEKALDICQKCRDYMMQCQSDDQSQYHMKYLGAVYKKLSQSKNLPDHLLNILEELEDFMLKYDIDRIYIDSENMFNHIKDGE